MNKKKKTKLSKVPAVTISPPIKKNKNTITIEEIKQGQYFLFNGSLYILFESSPKYLPYAIDLATGKDRGFDYTEIVNLVNVSIKWTLRK